MNHLPNKLLKLRKHYNYSQSYLAEVLDIETLEYMSFENGKEIPNYQQMKKLATLYHVDLSDIFRNNEEVPLYDIEKANTDEINIAYFLKEKTWQEKTRDYIANHKVIFVIFLLVIAIVTGLIIINHNKEPEAIEPEKTIIENINRLSVSETSVVYIDEKGNVNGSGDNSNGQININATDAIKVQEGEGFTIILHEDKTISSVGLLSKYEKELASLSNIIDIAVGNNHVVALDQNGKVTCIGDNSNGQCDLNGSKNIAKVFASAKATILVSNEGQISFSGNFIGSSKLKSFTNILDIDISNNILVVLDNTKAIHVFSKDNNYFKAESWNDIEDVTCGSDFVAGLDSYGKVHIDIENETISEEVNNWSDILCIDAGEYYLIGYDGNNLYGVGQNSYHQFNTSEVSKQTLPQVSNVEIEILENYVEVQFTGVSNASSYLVSMNVGTGIEKRLESSESVALFETENMTDGKTYTIKITSVGSGDYADSQPLQTKFQYEAYVVEEIDEEGNEETENNEG